MQRKKQFIQVKGNPLFERPRRPNEILKCSITGNTVLCNFPACAHLEAGPVSLREGAHLGPHRGQGFQHIWKEHHFMITERAAAEKAVFAFIRGVLVTGADIHYEPPSADSASISVRSPVGKVIVRQSRDGSNATVYYVITAFAGQPYGELIGQL